ncbi:hypothetical protein HanPSC8_Chr08g0316981 [Helianthus annuus]|nr:hypothetical protein HanPSC8_Chr08g0316981 [Helianthus annuus]
MTFIYIVEPSQRVVGDYIVMRDRNEVQSCHRGKRSLLKHKVAAKVAVRYRPLITKLLLISSNFEDVFSMKQFNVTHVFHFQSFSTSTKLQLKV